MTVEFFSDEAPSFRISEIFARALGVRQENFITCLFYLFSEVIGLNSVCFNSRKVLFSTAEFMSFIIIYICPSLRTHSKITQVQGCHVPLTTGTCADERKTCTQILF